MGQGTVCENNVSGGMSPARLKWRVVNGNWGLLLWWDGQSSPWQLFLLFLPKLHQVPTHYRGVGEKRPLMCDRSNSVPLGAGLRATDWPGSCEPSRQCPASCRAHVTLATGPWS